MADRRKGNELIKPLTLPPLHEEALTELRRRYEESPNAETRTRYQMLVLSLRGQTRQAPGFAGKKSPQPGRDAAQSGSLFPVESAVSLLWGTQIRSHACRPDLRLPDPACGYMGDRDENASWNIVCEALCIFGLNLNMLARVMAMTRRKTAWGLGVGLKK